MEEHILNGESMNIVEDNIEKLKTIFPDVFTEGKVDFDKLQDVLGNYVEKNDERYNFTWAGKQNALRLAQTPSTGTLRPCKEESKDWDTTQNLYIEGDNLEVLKLLQKSYHNKIKMIYIDPPYNTGNDFVYEDDFKDNIVNYKKKTGQVDSEGNATSTNSESDGRYHTNWLNMMYPRLRLARNLLTDNGLIFISIDDKEIENLKKICNEIFGEVNFVSNIIWQSRTSISNDQKVSLNHNYTLIFAKNMQYLNFYGELLDETEYSNPDNDSRGPWKLTPLDANKPGGDTMYPVLNPYTQKEYFPPNGRSWAINRTDMQKLIEDGRVKFGMNNDSAPKRKLYLYERLERGDYKTPSSIMIDGGTTKDGTNEVVDLFGGQKVFSYPKPTEFIYKLLTYAIGKTKNNIVLDFFSGSATTAHSVFKHNLKNIIDTNFILVQLPENLDLNKESEKDDAKKTVINAIEFLSGQNKPHLLTEIGKERIRRAGEKIKQEVEQGNQQLQLGKEPRKVPDIGFKVFKLDSSNIKKWNGNTENIEQELQGSIFNYVEGRTELDIVYEVMLKCGLDLTYPIEEIKVENKMLYSIGAGAMFVCMDNDITSKISDKIIEVKEENEIEEPVVVFKDNGFRDDNVKKNIKSDLSAAGIKDFITV